MKKLHYLLLLFLVLPFTGFNQNDSIALNDKQEPAFKNQIDLDFELVGFSFGYKRRVSKNWLVGLSMGNGVTGSIDLTNSGKTSFSDKKMALEVLHIGVTFKYYQTKKLQFEIEPRFYGLSSPHFISDFLYGEGSEGGTFLGIGFGVYYGGRVQIGYRIMVGFVDVEPSSSDRYTFFYPPSVTSSLLIMRIPIKR